jgi:hypothetical protein
MDLLRTISDAHASAIYSLCLSGSHVWSGSTDRSVRVWLAAGAHELLGAFLETALQGIYDLEARQRKGEEKIAQSEAYAKQNAEEVLSLRLKLKTQAGEALNAKHEMELLAQEVASVDQWQRKMQALKVSTSLFLSSSPLFTLAFHSLSPCCTGCRLSMKALSFPSLLSLSLI